MKRLISKLEPLIWLMFGQGLLIGTMLLTGWVLVVGLGVPLGIVSPEALAFERAHMLGANLIGRLVLLGLIVLPLWKGANHIRHLFIDFGVHKDHVIAPLMFGLATLGSLAGVVAVVRL
jgi:fumarate reductase subunit D